MNRITSISVALVLSLLCGLTLRAQMHTPVKSAGLEQLKSLAGEWDGTNAGGKAVHVIYQVVSNGDDLLERLDSTDASEMVTMYSADGDRIAVTHYCSAGNQPQMQTAPIAGAAKQFVFNFVRATNLASPAAGHMGKLVVIIQDHDHFTQEWTWFEGGKPAHTELFRFTRKS
jgi:hypothetical protein